MKSTINLCYSYIYMLLIHKVGKFKEYIYTINLFNEH